MKLLGMSKHRKALIPRAPLLPAGRQMQWRVLSQPLWAMSWPGEWKPHEGEKRDGNCTNRERELEFYLAKFFWGLERVSLFCFWQLNQPKQTQAAEKKEGWERESSRRQSDFTLVTSQGS